MFFARMRQACGRCSRPLLETMVAQRCVLHHGLAQPRVERLRDRGRTRIAKRAQVVKGHAAADDEDPLAAKRRERTANGQMFSGTEAALQGQLYRGHIGIRIREFQRDERSVVIATPFVSSVLDASLVEELPHTCGQ